MKKLTLRIGWMAIIMALILSGCIANSPTNQDIQATVDAALLIKEAQMETKSAQDRELMMTQVAGEFASQLEMLRSELKTLTEARLVDAPVEVQPTVPFHIATPTLSIGGGKNPTAAAVVTSGPGSCVNRFTFLSDVTFPDGTMTLPRTRFDKTWYIQNCGSCAMTKQYKIVYVSGSEVSETKEYPLFSSDKVLKEGESAPVSVPLIAPEAKGKYSTSWAIKSPDGKVYGAGADGNVYLTSVFEVGGQYNFYENLSGAACSDNNGLFFCGSSDRSAGRGAAYYNASPTMESNYAGGQSILIAPPMVNDGVTRVAFGPVRVTRGTWLRSAVSCPPNSPLCDNDVSLYIRPKDLTEQFVASTHEVNDGFTSEWNIALSDYGYHDQDLTFIFEVKANGGVTADDLIIFMNPRLTDIPPQ